MSTKAKKTTHKLPEIPSMSPDELRAIIDRLGFSSQMELARWLSHVPESRVVRRWASGVIEVPPAVAMLLRLMVHSDLDPSWVRETACRVIPSGGPADLGRPSLNGREQAAGG